jgi:hypothetical protein
LRKNGYFPKENFHPYGKVAVMSDYLLLFCGTGDDVIVHSLRTG